MKGKTCTYFPSNQSAEAEQNSLSGGFFYHKLQSLMRLKIHIFSLRKKRKAFLSQSK
jgi:hypothetical protein